MMSALSHRSAEDLDKNHNWKSATYSLSGVIQVSRSPEAFKWFERMLFTHLFEAERFTVAAKVKALLLHPHCEDFGLKGV